MHLTEMIAPVETTREHAAAAVLDMIREAWESDSLFAPNYLVCLTEKFCGNGHCSGQFMVRLHSSNIYFHGERTVFEYCFPDEEEAGDAMLEDNERYGALLKKDEDDLSEEECDEKSNLWTEAKDRYFGDEAWAAAEILTAVDEALARQPPSQEELKKLYHQHDDLINELHDLRTLESMGIKPT